MPLSVAIKIEMLTTEFPAIVSPPNLPSSHLYWDTKQQLDSSENNNP